MVNLEAYDATVIDGLDKLDISKELHGRRQIFTGEKQITRENVIEVLQKALAVHYNHSKKSSPFLFQYRPTNRNVHLCLLYLANDHGTR